MEYLFFVVAVVLIVAAFNLIVARAFEKTERGWFAAQDAHVRVESLLLAQNNSLHNRILARNWEDFAHLQNVPDDLSKVAYSDATMAEARNFGALASEMIQRQAEEQGDDLEGSNFEGPTVG